MLHQKSLCALALCFLSSTAVALEIGFESQVTANASDNVLGADDGEEEEGQLGFVQFGVFGEQKGTRASGAFSGEFISSRQLDDSDDNFSSITRFAGAAEFQITPRAFTWYVGDVLGTITAEDGLPALDDTDENRRNVFVTGPEFNFELDSFSRVNARLLYVNQTEDGEDLETLYSAVASYSFDTDNGNTFGFNFIDIFTDNSEETFEGDFNRLSLTGTWDRERGLNSYNAELGVTRFDTDEESLNGLTAGLGWVRRLTPQSEFRLSFRQDLQSQSLSTVEGLIATGNAAASDGDGFFDISTIEAGYGFASSISTFDIGASAGLSDFRLITTETGFSTLGDREDRTNASLFANYSRALSPRTRFISSLTFQQQLFQNIDDFSNSALGTLEIERSIGRSWEFTVGYRFFVAEGETSTIIENSIEPIDEIDVTENRITIGLRWAPPTRASQDLTIELQSLLQ